MLRSPIGGEVTNYTERRQHYIHLTLHPSLRRHIVTKERFDVW